jgi:putative membrane protein
MKIDPWTFHTHVDVWLITGALLAVYFYALRKHSRTVAIDAGKIEPSATRGQITKYVCGVGMIWLASGYPIHDIAENYLFSVHMLQHLLISLAAPPLLICGMPDWMLRTLFVRNKTSHGFFKFAFRPLVAGAFYNVVLVFTHWPAVVNGSLNLHFLHFAVHVLIFASAFCMWMPVFNRIPELPRMSAGMKMLYLFLMSIIPTVPSAFITFAEKPVYSFYANAPRPFSINAVEDQQLAGAIMKIVGGGFLWIMTICIFFRAYKSENPAIVRKLTMKDAERAFEESEPPADPLPADQSTT